MIDEGSKGADAGPRLRGLLGQVDGPGAVVRLNRLESPLRAPTAMTGHSYPIMPIIWPLKTVALNTGIVC